MDLKQATTTLAAQASHLGTAANHLHPAQAFIHVCDHYHLPFINPQVLAICYYITHLTTTFSSSVTTSPGSDVFTSSSTWPKRQWKAFLFSVWYKLLTSQCAPLLFTSYLILPHLDPHPALPPHVVPGLPGICHESLPHLHGDAQAEYSGSLIKGII